jgi:hypothetical protein
MNTPLTALAGLCAVIFMSAPQALGETQTPVSLFKVVTAKDEIFIGLTAEELGSLGGGQTAPAGRIASALADRKELTVWQYVHRKAANGDTVVAPLHPVGLLAHDSIRVEPYASPLAVLPHD